ncbi:hypothetical protein M427DRAFT_168883 [Gonapodya prolifera JEL478]|uniref:Uncharacterized protein n=1 Tax=Gonapodya prolifera (strain JEL478) TaxID=1344416 RepID=A0A139AZX1_GONPJ|nr:hypothetical protein M427DRAFT_168883 [Gonapodya prolifera JEL478]|eukprot:KXS22291.1 hypothetical protein M427DRAFT_168883 [Gonapodya prolifera JEL478]
MSGQGRYRDMWKRHADVDAIVWTIDDERDRIGVVRDEMQMFVDEVERQRLLSSTRRRPPPIVIFAGSSSDTPLSLREISGLLDLPRRLKSHDWFFCRWNRTNGNGLECGMDWLTAQVKRRIC